MSQPSLTADLELAEHLQRLTGTLAAAHAQGEVLDAVLTPAIAALQAVAGAVLLLDTQTNTLRVQAAQGQDARTLWQDGPLTPDTPASDVIATREPLYFEQAGELRAVYPDLEANTGGVAAVATALLPLLLDDRVLGVLILDFREPHTFTTAERRFLDTLAGQCSVALDRAWMLDELHSSEGRAQQLVVERTQALQAEQTALQAFAQFSEAAGRIDDLDELAQLALSTLQTLIPGANVVLTERTSIHWRLLHWTDNLDPTLLATIQAQGFPLDTPVFADLVQTGQASFVNGWDETAQEVPNTGQFQAVAHYPIVQDGEVVAAIGVAVTDQHVWTDTQRAIVQSVGRSFSLLYDRISAARQLQRQRDEAQRRSRALQDFALLSRDLAGETDRYTLIQRAQQIILSLLSPGYSLYWELAGDRWRLRAQAGDIGNPELQRLVDEEGLPFEAPALHSTWLTGVPRYQDLYDQGADTPAELIRHVKAATAFQVWTDGQPIGMLAVGLFDQRAWTPIDKAVLETAVYNLGLLLERARSVEALKQANLELQASNQELEAFSYSASHDLRTPVRHVKGFTELTEKTLEQPHPDLAKAARYLGLVSGAADRMNSLIDAMLVLSRAGRAELQVRAVSLETLAEQARQDALLEFPDQEVEWQIDALPTVQADAVTLQQVMTNLLSNAVKFAAPDRPLRVHVWAERRPQEWAVLVQDSGVGFDPRYTSKLFGVFQRLHAQQQFAGTGIGLATVRRIVTRHGGRVWAEGDLDRGATFGFTLPR